MWPNTVQISERRTNPLSDEVSTADTISQMRSIALHSFRLPTILWACNEALKGCLQQGVSGDKQIAQAIWYWIKGKVKFVTDEQTMTALGIPIQNPTKEFLISPVTLLNMIEPQGDCDDFSMLCASMLMCCGIRCSYITIAADQENPAKWSHVYVKAYPSGSKDIMMDASHGTYPGWEHKQSYRKREWPI